MTFDARADDSDSAQARIGTVGALAECARKAHLLTDRLRAEAAALRAERYQVHRHVDAIVFGFPEVMTRDASALARPPGMVPGSLSPALRGRARNRHPACRG
ncbi:hypothetical protein [Rhodococcus koreensis]